MIRRRRERLCGCSGQSPSCCPVPGSSDRYFVQKGFAPSARGLKSFNDATEIRAKLLNVFEIAGMEGDPRERQDQLTCVFIRMGPARMEMVGAMADTLWRTLDSCS
jgi:NADH:ubiquinone reductase (H+-translocating)